jgi:hypothetical protein
MSRPLPRFTQHAITTDPLEHHIAAMRAREEQARAAVQAGHTPQADPQDLRGIPCIARGVGGTSPHTDPYLQMQHWPER